MFTLEKLEENNPESDTGFLCDRFLVIFQLFENEYVFVE